MGKETEATKSAQTEMELRAYRTATIANTITKLGQTAFRYTGLAFIFYFAADALKTAAWAFAGRTTNTTMSLSAKAELPGGVPDWCLYLALAAMLVFAASVGYGRRREKLMKDNVESLAARAAQGEKKIDTKRSSSGLTKRGDTNPEDE